MLYKFEISSSYCSLFFLRFLGRGWKRRSEVYVHTQRLQYSGNMIPLGDRIKYFSLGFAVMLQRDIHHGF